MEFLSYARQVVEQTQLLEERYQEDGIYVKAYIPKDIYARLSF